MESFCIVIRAPKAGDKTISKTPGNIYTRAEAEQRAKDIAADAKCDMLVLEVVSGFGPTEPPVRALKITKPKQKR